MPTGVVLVDTGPLVALFDPSDRARPVCRAALDDLARSELVTTLAVITEVTYLVALAERLGTTRVFTLDSDFDVYRVGRKSFRRSPA